MAHVRTRDLKIKGCMNGFVSMTAIAVKRLTDDQPPGLRRTQDLGGQRVERRVQRAGESGQRRSRNREDRPLLMIHTAN